MKNISVIFGGKSVEHDISIITALQVMWNLPKNYNLIPIYIKPNGKFITAKNLTENKLYLNYDKEVVGETEVAFMPASQELASFKKGKIKDKIKIDCAVLCNHGHGGEDGSLQGLLEIAEVPYTSCDVASSAICMDKVLSKIMLEGADISTPAYLHFGICEYKKNKEEILGKIGKKIKFPCIVKPARLGSSVGIGICENEAGLEGQIENAFQFDDKIIVEKFIENAREFCCAVLKNSGQLFESRVVEVDKGKFFTFEEKYLKEKQKGNKEITKLLDEQIKQMAKEVYNILSCDGVVRVDFLYDAKNEKLFVNEVNSIPGSLAFNLFNTTFGDILSSLINDAIIRNQEKNKILYQFNSTAIENYINLTSSLKSKI